MKCFILSVLLICIAMTVLAQKDSICQAFIKKRYGSTYIQLPEKRKNDSAPPVFSDIRVIDCRQDTTRLGLSTRGFYRGQILFRTTAADAMTTYFQEHFTNPKGPRSLLVVIKDLWLFDDKDSTVIESFRTNVYTRSQGNIAFRYEAYLRTGEGYIPLTYLDTLGSSTAHSAVGMGQSVLPELLFLFMNKVAALDLDAISKKRKTITYHAIDSFSQTRYNYPMDTVTMPRKGVYASIDEFLDNQPSISDFETVKNGNAEMELHIRDSDGKLYYTHKMWGFSDGKHCYVMMDGTLFPILPIQHQFYVYGSKNYRMKKAPIPVYIPFPGGVLYGSATANLGVVKDLSLFRLDTRSGAIGQ